MSIPDIAFFDRTYVRRHLGHSACIGAVRSAMRALSAGRTRQLLRTMLSLGERRTFALMPGALAEDDFFGAKLISVFPNRDDPGRRAHRGLVVLFEPEEGHPVCIADAEEVTLIRTAAATAVATDALARADATRLTIFGTGAQAAEHVRALALVRSIERVVLWGRDETKAQKLAASLAAETGLDITVELDGERAAAQADIICTVSGAAQPILHGRWVRPGTHINLVGSSGPGPVEVDDDLVAVGRFVADSRASVLAQGAEFLVAKAAGRVDDSHVVAEIGEVLSGAVVGRQSAQEITVYKSLGHAVQDLAAVALLYRQRLQQSETQTGGASS
ncbi:ornithine cyclodeaminase family protein [Sphingomonas carotinifaciens]|uniref:Ornithine cyclodeaminase n=1 Tax=Sphingomonas carotinifaciens TaxID=1166323 RepID=A0A1G7Q0C1_9SPHN|nr:ornithine cyclodeaminase family protein [Sphingomonas carotinifaciens]MBB4087584.1 ornithine cyclodeaminase [Sphingomonas carotinifaciens]MWC45668.1 ornithine cyclodeaminase family protein [Sphingomonas carotinifaciens]SDF92002.1 ornithine cyclodeaminase [Sphingomonas carotinifaciens]